MRKNPGRAARRQLQFEGTRKKGDLTRKSTHKMRSKMGMKEKESGVD